MEDEWTKEELAEFQEVFSTYAIYDTGLMSNKDVAKALRKVRQYPKWKELKNLLNEIDVEGEGKIDFKQFLSILTKLVLESDAEQELREAFRAYDRGDKGYLVADDIRNAMNGIGVKLTDYEIEEMVHQADTNGDGKINFKEFSAVMFDPSEETQELML